MRRLAALIIGVATAQPDIDAACRRPIDAWDVSKVTTTNRMFQYAYKFNQPLDNWRLDKAKEIKYMFEGASKFKQDLGWCLDDDVNQKYAFTGTKCEQKSCGLEESPCVQDARGSDDDMHRRRGLVLRHEGGRRI